MSHTPIPPVEPRPYLMQNEIQHYEWGTRDAEAYIPRLLGISPAVGVPYGELWMGAHPKAPSHIIVNGTSLALDQWIATYPLELLGAAVSQHFDGQLPFLFKVLAAGEALSIQAHPNKAQAKLLHAAAPQHYPDDNHKPEVAIALDSLTALMGIKPFPELSETLDQYPEIANFIAAGVAHRLADKQTAAYAEQQAATRDVLVSLFDSSVTRPGELVVAIDALQQRLLASTSPLGEAEHLFLELRQKYPGPDVGLLALFLLNLVHLNEGEGMYADAGVPHAYLKGNIIECMANSDNVVRVGLTTKFKDARALVDILRYEPGPVAILKPAPDQDLTVYQTPAPEFRVSRLRLQAGATCRQQTGNRPVVYIVIAGSVGFNWPGGSQEYHRGQSIFIPALLSDFNLSATTQVELFKADVPIYR